MLPAAQLVVGAALALLAAITLVLGNTLQAQRAAVAGTGAPPASGRRDTRLLIALNVRQLGPVLLAMAIGLQMASLAFAPLIVVQPIAVMVLVLTAAVPWLTQRHRLSSSVLRPMAICTVSTLVFVAVAAATSTELPITNLQMLTGLLLLGLVLIVTGALRLLSVRRGVPPSAWILLAGTYSALVAVFGKMVLLRIELTLRQPVSAADASTVLTVGCIVGVALSAALAMFFVARAHAATAPQVAAPALTMVDVTVAVLLAVTILGEMGEAPGWTTFVLLPVGAIAVAAAFALARAAAQSTA